MPLTETQILQSPIAALDWVGSLEPELAIFGCVRQPKWSPPIVEHRLTVLGLRESE